MKTATFLEKSIVDLAWQIDEAKKTKDYKKSVVTRLKKRIEFVRTCLYYINTNPTKEFVSKEAIRIQNRINAFMETYEGLDETHMKTEVTKHRKKFEKEMDIPKLRTQLMTLHFILN